MAPPLADHVTAGLNDPVPVTVAVKARVAPGARLTHVGLTDTPVIVGAVVVTVTVAVALLVMSCTLVETYLFIFLSTHH